jgi:hypothetical protein
MVRSTHQVPARGQSLTLLWSDRKGYLGVFNQVQLNQIRHLSNASPPPATDLSVLLPVPLR